jgi:hypothetical protein
VGAAERVLRLDEVGAEGERAAEERDRVVVHAAFGVGLAEVERRVERRAAVGIVAGDAREVLEPLAGDALAEAHAA